MLNGTANTLSLNRQLFLQRSAKAYAAYLSHRLQLYPRVITEWGVRWSQQGDVSNDNEQLSPRLNVLFDIRDRTQLRMAWGVFYQVQSVEALQVEDGISEYFPAQRAEHSIIGLQQQLNSHLSLRLDIYKKNTMIYSHDMKIYSQGTLLSVKLNQTGCGLSQSVRRPVVLSLV